MGLGLGRQPALVTIHGSRLGISQADSNGNCSLLLDGYPIGGLSGDLYMSAKTGITALAGGGQSAASSLIVDSEVNVISVVGTTSDSVMLPSTAGKIPTGGCLSISVINRSSVNAAAVFPSSGEAINALAANASIALASSGYTIFTCYSSGLWISK